MGELIYLSEVYIVVMYYLIIRYINMLLPLPGYIYGELIFLSEVYTVVMYYLKIRYINMLLPLPGYIYGGVNLLIRGLHNMYVLFDNKIHQQVITSARLYLWGS